MGDWVRDESGALRRETIHRMTRRCRNWDYRCDTAYLITLELADRSRPFFGRLVMENPENRRKDAAAQRYARAQAPAHIDLSELGCAIDAHARRIGEFTPEIEVLAVQLMPEHAHLVLRVLHDMDKPLGEAICGFKAGAAGIYRRLCGAQGAATLFAPGFVDTILFDAEAVERGVAYTLDNPRRLAVKRLHPDLFKVRRELWVEWGGDRRKDAAAQARAQLVVPPHLSGGFGGWFQAIGNTFLLSRPQLLQVQCSRSLFAYRREMTPGGWRILRDAQDEPLVEKTTTEFEEKLAIALAAASHGAVLVSPCISHGEREIARRAFAGGHRVVTLQNKGFSPLYKPGGRLFEQCAAGNLLLLAPLAWPYTPGEKPPTRESSLVLNRIAQRICGSGAVEINYRGAVLRDVDRLVAAAVAKGDTPCP